MNRFKAILLSFIGFLLIIWSFYTVLHKPAPVKYQEVTAHTIRVGEYVLPIELADTAEEREQGFSGREKPLSGHGILFAFERPGAYGFWMKDMRFTLDIIWIDADWQVVGVTRGAAPESFPQLFYPETLVKYVLELPTGDADLFNIDVGTALYLDR